MIYTLNLKTKPQLANYDLRQSDFFGTEEVQRLLTSSQRNISGSAGLLTDFDITWQNHKVYFNLQYGEKELTTITLQVGKFNLIGVRWKI